MSVYLKNFFRFCFIILIQVLILNDIPLKWGTQTSGLPVFQPILYPIFILLLPFETPIWLLLALGFVTGISMDTFMNTGGHTRFCHGANSLPPNECAYRTIVEKLIRIS